MNLRRIDPKEKTTKDFKPLERVAYIPNHAHGNINHPDTIWGYVSSTNSSFVFVKFDRYLQGAQTWNITAQACKPTDLINFGTELACLQWLINIDKELHNFVSQIYEEELCKLRSEE